MQHEGEHRNALVLVGVVGVLNQIIIEVIALAGVCDVDNLEEAEVGIGAVELGRLLPGPVVTGHAQIADAGASQDEKERRCLVSPGATNAKEVGRRQQHQRQRGEVHRPGIGQQRNEHIANQDCAREAAERAQRGEPADVAADVLNGHREHPHQKRPDHCQQAERHEKEERRGHQRAGRQIVLEAAERNRFADGDRDREVNSGGENAGVKLAEIQRAIHQPAAQIIAARQRDERHGNLRGPDEM